MIGDFDQPTDPRPPEISTKPLDLIREFNAAAEIVIDGMRDKLQECIDGMNGMVLPDEEQQRSFDAMMRTALRTVKAKVITGEGAKPTVISEDLIAKAKRSRS